MGYTEIQNTPQEAVMNEVAVAEPEVVEYELNALDRCDHSGCTAQAYVITKHAAGLLYWCGHHTAVQELVLLPNIVHDTRDTLVQDRSKGSDHA